MEKWSGVAPTIWWTAGGLYLALSVIFVFSVHAASVRVGLDDLSQTGKLRVDQAAERLTEQLDHYRALVNFLATDQRVSSAVALPTAREGVMPFLRSQALRYGARGIWLLDDEGQIIADAAPGIGLGSSRARLAATAIQGSLGMDRRTQDGARLFLFSRGVFLDRGPPTGVVVVAVDAAALEFEWSVVPEAVVFLDQVGRVFVSNRPALIGALLPGASPETGPDDPKPVLAQEVSGKHAIWSFADFSGVPERSLVVSRDAPRTSLQVLGFLNVDPVHSAADQRALLAVAALTVLGFGLLLVNLWRRRVADRLQVEARSKLLLEQRVAERTEELRSTQEQLIQATKMTALGQLSAGISHELNQPLAAITNFAENAQRLIDLDRVEEADGNLVRIRAQVDRITRIVRNLRAFARSEVESLDAVDLVQIVDEALGLLKPMFRESGVSVERLIRTEPVPVQGGSVRLQQVIVNLLSNAIDAMSGQEAPRIILTLSANEETAILVVRDFGPGIVDPDRVFEPFYSTKELGASKGLGLGLSISYGIIGSFGGRIEALNHPEGGAVFKVTLRLAEERIMA